MKTTSALFLGGLWLFMLVPDPAHAQCEDQQLLADDGMATHQFGTRVDTDGISAIISAPGFRDVQEGLAGAAYIFELAGDPGTWTQKAQFKGANTNEVPISFGFAVAIQGNHALVTAPHYDLPLKENTGAVFYFHREGSPLKWEPKQTMFDDVSAVGLMGRSIDINSDGDVFVVGALDWAYVYTRNGTTWSMRGSAFQGSDLTTGDLFGRSVAIDDEAVVVGSPFWDTPPPGNIENVGKVYGYSWSGSAHTEDFVKTGDGVEGDQFGSEVVMNSRSLLICADGANSGAGEVFPYRWNPGTSSWDAITSITVSDSTMLGRAIGLAGSFAVLSSHNEDNAEGAAYLTVLDTDADPPAWGTPVKFQASSPQTTAKFSWDLAAGGVAIAIIGEIDRNLPGEVSAGAAYIFDMDCDP